MTAVLSLSRSPIGNGDEDGHYEDIDRVMADWTSPVMVQHTLTRVCNGKGV